MLALFIAGNLGNMV